MNILVVNAGSSSLKYQLIDMNTKQAVAKGGCERIGLDGAFLKHKANGQEFIIKKEMPTHSVAIKLVLDTLIAKETGVIEKLADIDAVGHRVVHSGEDFNKSVVITDEVLEICKKNTELAPLHQPANLTGIYACKEVMPNTPMVAVFDTAFHSTIPDYAFMYAIPYEYYTDYKVRRYGFHGTSHKFVSKVANDYLNGDNKLKIVTCHLGNGSSISAVKEGKCVDTSMGFTPLEGVPMGTRSGDIDPAVVEYLCNKLGKTTAEVLNILNKKSGVFGISGVSSDFRDIRQSADEGNKRAELALNTFAYKCKKYIGSYAAAMGGIDVLVFTAGIGENVSSMRKAIATDLEFLGIKIDEAENEIRTGEVVHDISAKDSKVKVLVIATNEELVIAEETQELVK